jgi:hypothetical protein
LVRMLHFDMRLPIRFSNDDTDFRSSLDAVAQRLDRLIELTNETNELLRSAPTGQPRSGGQPASDAADVQAEPRTARRRAPSRRRQEGRRSRTERRSTGLHIAIETVLRDAQEPLTAAEIAQRVNERGLFVPRSGESLKASQVNSRIANPHYRGRFRRVDGRVALATREAAS